MNNRKIIELVCLGVLGIVIPHAKADEWNQKTVFTFSGPVEVPGRSWKRVPMSSNSWIPSPTAISCRSSTSAKITYMGHF
jgi:hypothetical protein